MTLIAQSDMYLWAPLFLGVAITLVAMLLGLIPLACRNTRAATVGEGAARFAAALVVVLGLYFIVPKHEKIFADFGIKLPQITQYMIFMSNFFVNYWFLVIPSLMLGAALDVMGFQVLHRSEATRSKAKALSIVITAIFGFAVLLSAMALLLPLISLLEKLS